MELQQYREEHGADPALLFGEESMSSTPTPPKVSDGDSKEEP
jgi:hypothetical protein